MSKPSSQPTLKKSDLVDLVLGPLPVEAINRTLGLELEPGDVIFSAGAQVHAAKRHSLEYAQCLPHAGAVATNPSYVGDDFKNTGKIELVRKVPGLLGGVLLAIAIEIDDAGFYRVVSMYPVSERKIENRRQNRHLVITQSK